MTQFNAVADRLVAALSHVANGQTVFSMHQYFCHIAMDVIAEVCVVCVFYVSRKRHSTMRTVLLCSTVQRIVYAAVAAVCVCIISLMVVLIALCSVM